jgi:hypothetical protein
MLHLDNSKVEIDLCHKNCTLQGKISIKILLQNKLEGFRWVYNGIEKKRKRKEKTI